MNKRYGGAYYLVGYAVECGLKACIAKLTKAEEFYDKNLARKIFQHNLAELANYARLSRLSSKLEKRILVSRPTGRR